jgi:2-C-methyl-D-erythritol 4-phosphate cytidylyltransferase
MAVALVVAAGRGERLGLDRPKALIPIAGRPMLEWSVEALREVPGVRSIVVALPAESLHLAPRGCIAVAGGAVRSDSVRRALAGAPEREDPVIVHDAARPLTPPSLFSAVLAELDRTGADAVLAAAPVTDTIKEVCADRAELTVARTLDRSRLWAVQTPQVFRRRALADALAQASEAVLANATDDAWLIERAGGTVTILPVLEDNLKITTAADLRLAEALLQARREAIAGVAEGGG